MRLIDIEDAALLKTVSCGGLSAKKLWKRINEQPTIEIAKAKHGRPTGEWTEYSDNYGHSSYFCSRCGTQEDKPSGFCPNCGADMRGGDDND